MNKAIKDKAIEFRRINLNYIPLVVLIVLVSCTGILPDIFITVGSLICVMMLAFTPCLYLAVPVMVFYHSQLGIIAGISAFRLFTFLFFAVMLYQQKDKISLKKTIPLCIIVLYDLLVLSQYNVRMAVFNIFDHICIWMIVVFVFNSKEKIVRFFHIYHISMISAFITGLITSNSESQNTVIANQVVEMTRFNATFEDPNYMGFFYIIGIFAMVTLKMYSKRMRFLLAVLFYIMIMFGMSVTAVVVSIFLWVLYFVVTKRLTVKAVLLTALILCVVFQAYSFALQNPDAPVIGSFALRIDQKIESILEGDVDDFTTERSSLSAKHMEFFQDQTIFKKLFGGNIINTRMKIQLKGVAHNEYIDLLLNVGILGTAIFLVYLVIDLLLNLKNAWKYQSELSMFSVMSKFVWILYAMTLTVFLDYRFFMFFLL